MGWKESAEEIGRNEKLPREKREMREVIQRAKKTARNQLNRKRAMKNQLLRRRAMRRQL
jgi:hypothetical protein